MNIFDIIGPIMIGPSSSHTAGIVRIGLMCKSILNTVPKKVTITWYGSLATTYVGHGSDKAIIAGLLGFQTDDKNIIDSLDIAKKEGMDFCFETSKIVQGHPNTVKVSALNDKGQMQEIIASSVGGGAIIVQKIDNLDVLIDGTYDTLFINHIDEKGVVKNVTDILYKYQVNIGAMKVYRSEKSGNAIMVIESDHVLTEEITKAIEQADHVKKAIIIPKI